MKLQEKFKNKWNGELTLSVIDNSTGDVISKIIHKNLIVNTGYESAAKALAGQAAITYIQVGTSAIPPVPEDTTIQNAVTIPFQSVEFPGSAVKFNFEIEATMANGMDIVEFGLITQDGKLFSRLVRDEIISKTEEIAILGSWKINL